MENSNLDEIVVRLLKVVHQNEKDQMVEFTYQLVINNELYCGDETGPFTNENAVIHNIMLL